jgi:FdhD protein
MDSTRLTDVIRAEGAGVERVRDTLVREARIVVRLDGREVLDAVCTPGDERELAVGHLVSEGWLESVQDVVSVSVDAALSEVSVCRRGSAPPGGLGEVTTTYETLRSRVAEVAERGEIRPSLFAATGGAHTAAVCPAEGSDVVAEDISRACALDKAFGKALLGGVDVGRSILFLTSRVPRQFIRKAARVGIPIVAAVSAPTYEAVEEAERLGICLCGFVRPGRMNVYSQGWRVGVR